MPNGQTPKIYRPMVNVPGGVSKICNQLPREGSCEEIILVNLKKKFSVKGHVYFEPVRPHKVTAALAYLQRINPLYHDVLIRDSNINENLLSIGSDLPESDIDFEVKSNHGLEFAANPLRGYRHVVNVSLLVENKNLLGLAPGQDKETKHILFNEKFEELAFPKTFFKGNFGYTFRCEHYLTSTGYFNRRLLNCLQTLVANSDHIFFAQSVLQRKNLSDQINMAMKKVTGRITAGIFASYEESVRNKMTKVS